MRCAALICCFRSELRPCCCDLAQPPAQPTTVEQARTIRRKLWLDQQWRGLIGSVVDEVFGTAEVDEGTMDPTRLNSANRTRWLCERTMRSDKRMDEVDLKVDTIEAKVDEMMAQHKATMEKLDALLSR